MMPVTYVRAEGEENDVGGTDQGFYFRFPFVRVGLETVPFHGTEIQMAPAVGGKFPAIVTQTLGYLCGGLAVLLVGFGAGVGRRSAVAENALVAGKGQNRRAPL